MVFNPLTQLWQLVACACVPPLFVAFQRKNKNDSSVLGSAFLLVCSALISLIACEVAACSMRTSVSLFWLLGVTSFFPKIVLMFALSPVSVAACFAICMYFVCIFQLVSQKVAGRFGERSALYHVVSHALFDWLVQFFVYYVVAAAFALLNVAASVAFSVLLVIGCAVEDLMTVACFSILLLIGSDMRCSLFFKVSQRAASLGIVDYDTFERFVARRIRLQLYQVLAGLNRSMYKLDAFLVSSAQ